MSEVSPTDAATNEGMPPAVDAPVSRKPITLGRIVHYVLPATSPHAGEDRAAIVTQVWSDSCCNLCVHKGQSNDFANSDAFAGHIDTAAVALVGSVSYSEGKEPGTWHWPETV